MSPGVVVRILFGALLLACEQVPSSPIATTQDDPAPTHGPDNRGDGHAGFGSDHDAALPLDVTESMTPNEAPVDSSVFITESDNARTAFCECDSTHPGVTISVAEVDETSERADAGVDAAVEASKGLVLQLAHPDFVGPDCGDQLLRGYGSSHCDSRITVHVCAGADARPPCIGFSFGRVEYVDANGLVYRGEAREGAIAFDAVMPSGAITGSFLVAVSVDETMLWLSGTFEFCGRMDPTRPPC